MAALSQEPMRTTYAQLALELFLQTIKESHACDYFPREYYAHMKLILMYHFMGKKELAIERVQMIEDTILHSQQENLKNRLKSVKKTIQAD